MEVEMDFFLLLILLNYLKLMVIIYSWQTCLHLKLLMENFKRILYILILLKINNQELTCKFLYYQVLWVYWFLPIDGSLFLLILWVKSIWNSDSMIMLSFHSMVLFLNGSLLNSSSDYVCIDLIMLYKLN